MLEAELLRVGLAGRTAEMAADGDGEGTKPVPECCFGRLGSMVVVGVGTGVDCAEFEVALVMIDGRCWDITGL